MNHPVVHIHLQHNGKVHGPYTIEEVRLNLEQGRISPQHYALREGAPRWVPIFTIPEVSEGLDYQALPAYTDSAPLSSPSLKKARPQMSSVDHRLVCICAFAPLLGVLVNLWAYKTVHSSWIGSSVSMLFSIALLTRDDAQLRSRSVDTTNIFGSVALVPVYLFKRAQVVGGGNGYAITWVITFLIYLFVPI